MPTQAHQQSKRALLDGVALNIATKQTVLQVAGKETQALALAVWAGALAVTKNRARKEA